MSRRFKPRLPSRASLPAIARLLVPLVLFALLWRVLDGGEIVATLRDTDFGLLAAALAAILVQNITSALRWRLTAARLDQRIGAWRAVREYFLSQFVNLTLPAGVLGDAGRAVRTRHEVGLARSGQAVLIERLVGQLALFAVLTVGIALVAVTGGLMKWPAWIGETVLWFLAVMVGATLLFMIAARVISPLARLSAAFREAVYRSVLAEDVLPRQAALSLLIVSSNIGGFALAAAATGSVLPITAILSVLPLILVSMVLPITVGGWGVRESVAAALWPVIGFTAEAGVAASVAFGLVILVAALPGALTPGFGKRDGTPD